MGTRARSGAIEIRHSHVFLVISFRAQIGPGAGRPALLGGCRADYLSSATRHRQVKRAAARAEIQADRAASFPVA